MITRRLLDISNRIKSGDLSILNNDNVVFINDETMRLLNTPEHNQQDIVQMGLIVGISNVLYNNTDRELLPLEDGVYDLLLELYKKYNPIYQVGAEPVHFESSNNINEPKKLVNPIRFVDTEKIDDMLFGEELLSSPKPNRNDILINPIRFDTDTTMSRRVTNTKHVYPKLVGTLDKCKFVLNSQAHHKGVFDDSNVQIFERDFIQKHIEAGILDPNRKFYMVAELKYDGVSVEAEVSNIIHSARTRGDANEDIAADLTPILGGKKFNQARQVPEDNIFGMKFEGIMTYYDLARYNQIKGKDYKNCRTAISGLIASSDAPKYADLMTLVPLATSIEGIDRLSEIEFMNKYYHSGECLRYAILHGDYIHILFQVKMFLEEAEYLRPYMPFMYDGIVVSYIEPDLIDKLGRVNSVNKYSMAIKFNPLRKQSTFRGYSFTVGQDGSVTPMIHYDPVEFYGTIHAKSTGHSYQRFKELNLREGDVIDVEYVNDVMPYVSKPDNSNNLNNPNEPVKFIEECPSCHSILRESDSGKSMMCDNIMCQGRAIARMVNMMDKLNLKDFSEESLTKIGKYTLTGLLNSTLRDVEMLGDKNSEKFIERMNELKTVPIYDYRIIGSLGFTDIAVEKWKIILNKYSIQEILEFVNHGIEGLAALTQLLVNIKGIGPITAQTISRELPFFKIDLKTIASMSNIIKSKGVKSGKSIRFTGFRDKDLIDKLNSMGHDANGNSGITKTTDILLVPYEGYTSPKTTNAAENGTLIIPISEFSVNMDKYL